MKKLILILLIILLGGCGVPAGEAGADGINGSSGSDGRDNLTPCIRPYTRDSLSGLILFSDVDNTQIIMSYIGYGNTNNCIVVRVPAGNIGADISVLINGIQETITVPVDTATNITFDTGIGSNSSTTKFMNCSQIDVDSSSSYFAYYVDGIEKEFYWSNTFRE